MYNLVRMNAKQNIPQLIKVTPERRCDWVLYQLKILGISVSKLAAAHGVSAQAMRNAFVRPYPRMEKALADALGLMPQELFPERYDADGLPNRKRGRPVSSGNTCCHVNKITSFPKEDTGSSSQSVELVRNCHGEAE